MFSMRKPASKFLSLFLVLAMVCSLFGAAFAAEEETATPYVIPDVDGKVVILHTNDTHGADLDEEGTSFGMAGVAQLKKDFEAAGADVLLVSAGDSIMGKPLVSADQGKSAIEFMNAAGYDAMTVGNHELDFGIDNLKALAKDADFPILCADMTTEADGKTVFDSNKIFEIGGVKVGVFGLATPETLTKADASKMPGITFPQTDKLYAVAQAQVDAQLLDGCSVIAKVLHALFLVAQGHMGPQLHKLLDKGLVADTGTDERHLFTPDEFCKLLLIFLHKERTSSMKIQAEIDSLLHFTPFPANWQRQTLFWPRMHRNPI